MKLAAIAILCSLNACVGTAANASTCSAYEAAASTGRAVCHAVCDRIPNECPWRNDGGE